MLFKKKSNTNKTDNSELPELPALPTLPKLPDSFELNSMESSYPSPAMQSESLPTLPALPSVPSKMREADEFQQEEIKTAVRPRYTQEIDSPVQKEVRPRVYEFQSKPFIPEKKENKPVFIRIDKYQEAIEAISEIYQQLQEIENYLNDIKEMKSKEDNELIGWDNDIQSIKSKLEAVDKNILNKIE